MKNIFGFDESDGSLTDDERILYEKTRISHPPGWYGDISIDDQLLYEKIRRKNPACWYGNEGKTVKVMEPDGITRLPIAIVAENRSTYVEFKRERLKVYNVKSIEEMVAEEKLKIEERRVKIEENRAKAEEHRAQLRKREPEWKYQIKEVSSWEKKKQFSPNKSQPAPSCVKKSEWTPSSHFKHCRKKKRRNAFQKLMGIFGL